jgi:hypothetical protein
MQFSVDVSLQVLKVFVWKMPIFQCNEKALRTICDEGEGMSNASETFMRKH